MSRYRVYIFFSIIIATGLGAIFFVSQGYYPIAVVDGNFISAKRFAAEYTAVFIYNENLLKTSSSTPLDSKSLSPEDLQLTVMNGIIEKVLISRGAKDESGKEFDYLVQNKLDKFFKEMGSENVSASLYGLSNNEFEDNVLVPRAEKEILAGRLYFQGEKIEDWLRKAKAAASVIIFSPRFGWNGQEVTKSD